jgi:soluble lytic murein transglycosylase-like protein
MIVAYSHLVGLDPHVPLAIAKIESNYKVHAVGPKGEIGVFQLNPSAYPDYKVKDLKNVKTNVELGIKTLKKMKDSCPHKRDWVLCYNTGVTGAKRIKNPKEFPYVKKFNKAYTSVKYKRKYKK